MIPFKLGGLTEAARHTDKGPSLHHYTEVYERFMFDRKNDPIKIFEIGIAEGGSLEMWQEYFPKATIAAVDIFDKSKFANSRVTTLIADQANRDQLKKAVDAAGGPFDIVLDDGGHTMEQQQISFGFLFDQVTPGGYYILEDVHTSIIDLWKGYGAARDRRNTTLKMIQDYMWSVPPRFASEFLTAQEVGYLNDHVEYVNLVHRSASSSIVAIIRKK